MAKRLVLREPHGQLSLDDYEPEPPGDCQIQVKTIATSLNHLDWKRLDKNLFIPSFPHVLGMDIAGEVVDAGQSEMFKVGDLVIAPGAVGYSNGCSFQTHVLVNERDCAKIDCDIPATDLATLPFSLATAACGLYLGLGIDRLTDTSTPILIWGANGAVGKLAVQLAKLSGYSVVAVTSARATPEAVKARGADAVFRSSDPDLIAKIRAAAPGLSLAFDTVVTLDTVSSIERCLGRPARVATAIKYLGPPIEDVEVVPVFSGEVMGKTMTGQTSPRGRELGDWLWSSIPRWLKSSKISPLEKEEIAGLEAIPEGLEQLRRGTARAKLVARVQ
ncbi:GroES-like protein [Colletotrichum falcatum]|nr:GroES-like protein [Colletotrichum falcatum]